MSSTTITIHTEDLVVFAAVSKHPFTVVSTQSQPQGPKCSAPAHLKKVYRQRILAFVEANPGATSTAIRRGVTGYDGSVNVEVIAMREDGTLRVEKTIEHGTPIRHYLADTIEDQEAA